MSSGRRAPPASRPSAPPSAATPGEPAGDVLLFVDAIEGDRARLLLGAEAFEVPRRLLPADAKEGAWVRAAFSVAPSPPDEGAALRNKLGGADDGGDIKL
jgi:hypothetical protein